MEEGEEDSMWTRGMLERRKGRRGSWVLGEIKGKGAHHGSLTDFGVVMFVATVAYIVICIAKWGEQSALNSLARIYKLPMMEVPSLQVISVVNFH